MLRFSVSPIQHLVVRSFRREVREMRRAEPNVIGTTWRSYVAEAPAWGIVAIDCRTRLGSRSAGTPGFEAAGTPIDG